VGLHWYISGTSTGQQDSGDTFVSAYASQIAAAEALLPTAAVPEPSSLALLGIGMAAVFGVLRRRRAIK
jgi:PEP-CTERM motif